MRFCTSKSRPIVHVAPEYALAIATSSTPTRAIFPRLLPSPPNLRLPCSNIRFLKLASVSMKSGYGLENRGMNSVPMVKGGSLDH